MVARGSARPKWTQYMLVNDCKWHYFTDFRMVTHNGASIQYALNQIVWTNCHFKLALVRSQHQYPSCWLFATALSWVGFLIAGTTWVCSVLITISILTDPSLDRSDSGCRVVVFSTVKQWQQLGRWSRCFNKAVQILELPIILCLESDSKSRSTKSWHTQKKS